MAQTVPHGPIQSRVPTALVGNPTIAFRTTYKVIGNLLGGLSTRDCDPVPPSLFVIDEDMRTTTLDPRLTFESHSIAAGSVANLSAHLDFTARQQCFLIRRTGCITAPAHLV